MRHLIQMLSLVVAIATANAPALAQLKIGQTAGFTGPVAAGVKETTEGAMLYFNAINALGGINGQTIELISLDDKFDPKTAAVNARQLVVEHKVLALFLTRGTPHTEAVFPVLEEFDLALVAPSTGAMVMHQPVKRHVFNVRATYQREAEKAVTHLHSRGIQRFAILHPDDSFGADALAGAQSGLTASKLKSVFTASFSRAKPDFSAHVPQLAKLNPQVIVLIGSGSAVVDGNKGIRAAGSNAQIVTLSNNASGGFIKQLGELGRGVIVTQVFPYERSISYPLVKQALDHAKAAGLSAVTPAMLEGYAGAKVMVEGLRRAGKNPSREKILSALDALKAFDIGGLTVAFSQSDHTGLDFADLSIIGTDGKFKR